MKKLTSLTCLALSVFLFALFAFSNTASALDNTYTIVCGKANRDKLGNVINEYYATKEEVGDISTALDGIIAIQNNLLGVSE